MRTTILIFFIALFLSGCASKPRSLYYWGNYQPELYGYLKGDSKGHKEQIGSLEEPLQKARSQDMHLPPGYYAHVGLLHLEDGNLDEFKKFLEIEKELFPESAEYVGFLLKTFKE